MKPLLISLIFWLLSISAALCENTESHFPIDHAPGGHVEIEGVRIWVESHGSGPALFVLAGGPANSHAVMHPAFDAMTETHTVVYYDYRGRGRSDSLAGYRDISFQRDVEDLEALRSKLGHERISLYGFSYGGLIAQGYALAYPDHVNGIVLANTLHGPEMWADNHANINREMRNQFPDLWERVEEVRSRGGRSFDPEIREVFAKHHEIIRWRNPDLADRLRVEPGSTSLELYRYFAGDDIEFEIGGQILDIPDFRPLLRDIQAPALVLAGRYDRALFPRLQWEFVEHFPQACFIFLERSGSFGHIEEPETVIPLISLFFSSGMQGEGAAAVREAGLPCIEPPGPWETFGQLSSSPLSRG